MGKCKSCGKLSELINERHEFGSDGTCVECGYNSAYDLDTDIEETETSVDGDSSKDNTNIFDLFENFNPLVLIPVVVTVGLIAIVAVIISQRKRK
jgi:hypothetical protein